jgi:hypothetical protein
MAKLLALPCADGGECHSASTHNCSVCATRILSSKGFREDGRSQQERSKSVRVVFTTDPAVEVDGTEVSDGILFRAVPLSSIITHPRFD